MLPSDEFIPGRPQEISQQLHRKDQRQKSLSQRLSRQAYTDLTRVIEDGSLMEMANKLACSDVPRFSVVQAVIRYTSNCVAVVDGPRAFQSK